MNSSYLVIAISAIILISLAYIIVISQTTPFYSGVPDFPGCYAVSINCARGFSCNIYARQNFTGWTDFNITWKGKSITFKDFITDNSTFGCSDENCARIICGCPWCHETEQVVNESVPNEAVLNTSAGFLRSTQTLSYRSTSYEKCIGLVNHTVNTSGSVLYEECGKNCLGGCSNSGPLYCFYGVNTTEGCILYVKSRITSFMSTPERIFSNYSIGQEIELSGLVTKYQTYDCDGSPSECTYFVIGDVW